MPTPEIRYTSLSTIIPKETGSIVFKPSTIALFATAIIGAVAAIATHGALTHEVLGGTAGGLLIAGCIKGVYDNKKSSAKPPVQTQEDYTEFFEDQVKMEKAQSHIENMLEP